MKFKDAFPWFLIILLNITIWIQVKMNYDKDERIKSLERCIDNLKERVDATNATAKAIIVK